MRGWIKRLEREAEEKMIAVLQPDGTVKRFPESTAAEALLALMDGHDHPLAEAVRNSPDPKWTTSFYNMFPVNRNEIEDLSEP